MDKRKFLFASISGLIGDIAWEVQKEGHDVRYYIEAEGERDIADGFVPKRKRFVPRENPSLVVLPTPTAWKMIAPLARKSSRKPASTLFPTRTSTPSIPPLNS